MFEVAINPVFFQWGIFELRYYGLFYALGFVITYIFLKRYKKAKALWKNPDDVDTLLLYLIFGVVIGARLMEVLAYQPQYYLANPLKIIAVWQGGLSFHGGLLGAVIAVYGFARKKGYKFLAIADLLCIPGAVALAIGRVANFLNGELYGRITTVPWAVHFAGVDGWRHPSQLYEMAKNLLIAAVLLRLDTKKRKPGEIFALFLLLYGALRFTVEFFREPEVFVGVLTMGQALSLPLILIAWWMYKRIKQKAY